ncbi:alanine--glyoxylate aminotransferase family protein [Candidatus Bipolaricaulota bacterium]|jgi:alanine-glyoxylate transaminase/serine-glyoxylate transaminase/serine-pyruvate transaminase|nr:alanine--glyoxylate aminotransferase family protein [Candidatus Bipolaricaulota bacterium]TFH07834.1 MAG: alanine--glyoxylate aminotransferase family protein [Candidatus Atribacteria bacterium]
MKDRSLLMIPGPIEFEPEVLQALGAPTTSHVAPNFIEAFGRALEAMRKIWLAPEGQPFVVAGSGTLAMELAGANLVEPGDRALVLSTGVFGDRFEDLLSRHGADVTVLRAPIGQTLDLSQVEDDLRSGVYKILTVTHVDTSTAVRMPIREIGELARRYNVLSIVDGVCSVAGEEIWQDEWNLDVVLTASQKAIGVPPGLALLVASQRAMAAFASRETPVRSYYADWAKWLPIMQAYEARKPSYFGTPAVNLVAALDVSLRQIVDEGMTARFARHEQLAGAFRAGAVALGMNFVATEPQHRANTLTACRYPNGVAAGDLLPAIKQAGVIVAGGLHPEIKSEYFRVGHMGAVSMGDILAALGAIEIGLRHAGHVCEPGIGVAAALQWHAAHGI